jgi:hypothetical protein
MGRRIEVSGEREKSGSYQAELRDLQENNINSSIGR